MMRGLIFSFLGLLFLTSCSNVRLAIYDYQKKQEKTKTESNFSSANTKSSEVAAKKALTQKASSYIGTNYRYGSCDAGKGFDCSGLVYHVARSQDIVLPRSSQSMSTYGPHIHWKKAEPGDLIFFGEGKRINHVGIVDKNSGHEMWIIHSTNTLGVVRENILVSDYWRSRVLFAVDIISPNVRA